MKGFKKDGKFRPTEKTNKSSLKKSDMVKRNKHSQPKCSECGRKMGMLQTDKCDDCQHNSKKDQGKWEITETKYGRDKQSLDEVETQCGLCGDTLIIPDVEEEVKIDEHGDEYVDCNDAVHQSCYEFSYGTHASYEDWIKAEAKKRGISEEEMKKIDYHEHGYDRN